MQKSFIISLSRCFLRLNRNLILKKYYCQKQLINPPTLYVPSRYEIYKIVKPLIEEDYIIENIDELQSNCKLRNLNVNINEFVEKIKVWKETKVKYSVTKVELKDLIREIKSLQQNNQCIINLREQIDMCKDIENKLKEQLYELEDYLMPLFSKLPNKLHPLTPKDADVFEHHNSIKDFPFQPKSHVTIAKEMYCMECSSVSPTAFFLTGRLSILEQAIQNYFHSEFEDFNFILITGVDFCKSFVLEACGKDPYSIDHCIVLEEDGHELRQRLNLVGSSSLESMCAYFINMNVDLRSLPLKHFTQGRIYNPSYKYNTEGNFFNTVQSNCTSFTIASDGKNPDENYDALRNIVVSTLFKLQLPLRVVNLCAKHLKQIECRRTQLEVWSPYLRKFIFVANVSQYNDFLSKRLKMTCGSGFDIQDYLSIVHGHINMTNLLGLMIENTQLLDGSFVLPNVLQECMLS